MIRVLERLSPADRRKLEAGVVEVTGEAKNRTILGIVAGIMKLYPNITFAELKELLPDSLNPKSTNRTTNFFHPYTDRPYGVVQPGTIRMEIAEANRLKQAETGAEEHYKMVHFTGEGETFRTGDGVEVLVANGIEDADLQRLIQHVARYGVRVVEFAPYRGGGKKGFYNVTVVDPALLQKLQVATAAKWLIPAVIVLLLLLLLGALVFFLRPTGGEAAAEVPVIAVQEPLRISGSIFDKVTGDPLTEVRVGLRANRVGDLAATTDGAGVYSVEGPSWPNGTDTLNAVLSFSKDGYLVLEEEVSLAVDGAAPMIQLGAYYLEPYVDRAIQLPHIAYAKDRYELTPEAKDSLEAFYQVLVDNPSLVVEVRSHTDARPAPQFRGGNAELSRKRAESCVEYLVSRGIDPARLVAVGMGSEEPLIPMDSIMRVGSVDDMERLHALNRRSDFKVLDTGAGANQ